jgi:Transcription factor WhiB
VSGQRIASDVMEIDERAAPPLPRSWRAVIGVNRFAALQQVGRLEPACWGVDPEVFFGPADSPSSSSLHRWERRALAVCAGCPLRTACLSEALEFPAVDQYGVVGGMTAGQRRAALRTSRRGRGRTQRSAATLSARGPHRGPRPARP